MATKKRTSDQGTVFDASTVRGFLLTALGHDAVIDRVNDLLFEHVMERKYHPSVVATSLEPIIDEVLDVATFEDWDWVARTLIAEACGALGVESTLKRAPEVQPPQTPTKTGRAWRNLDPGELREELAEIYTHNPIALRASVRAWWITRRISQLTGISREQIKADATIDAEAIKATDEESTNSTDQSSGHPDESDVTIDAEMPPVIAARKILRYMRDHGGAVYIEDIAGREYEGAVLGLTRKTVTLRDRRTKKTTTARLPDIRDMIEVEVDIPNVFVRPLASEEAHTIEFIQTGEHTSELDARAQTAIILGSNAGCTTSQLATLLAVDESKVRKVIADFNEHGIAEITRMRRHEREQVIETARKLDPQVFQTDIRDARPGKYEGESDLLVVALDIVHSHGLADETKGDAATSGYAWRIRRFVGIEDPQGFITAEEYPTNRLAIERLRDFNVATEDEEA
jgi:Winged helix-turn helix